MSWMISDISPPDPQSNPDSPIQPEYNFFSLVRTCRYFCHSCLLPSFSNSFYCTWLPQFVFLSLPLSPLSLSPGVHVASKRCQESIIFQNSSIFVGGRHPSEDAFDRYDVNCFVGFPILGGQRLSYLNWLSYMISSKPLCVVMTSYRCTDCTR